MRHGNPVSAAIAEAHPNADAEFYANVGRCAPIGELFDLALNFMHVHGRNTPVCMERVQAAIAAAHPEPTP